MTTTFRSVAAEVQQAITSQPRTEFSRIASEVHKALSGRFAAEDRDAEWQRVNSYVADVLKDSHVLYAKLARLQGDFAGEELARLSKVSEAVLAIGDELSRFSKAFYEGKYEMLQSEFTYGQSGGAPVPNPQTQSPEDVEAGAGGTPVESLGIEALGEGDEEAETPAMKSDEEEGDEEIPDYEAAEEESQEQAAE